MIFESVKFWGGSVAKSDSAGVLHSSFMPQSWTNPWFAYASSLVIYFLLFHVLHIPPSCPTLPDYHCRVRKKAMEVCVKQGEIVNKHLKVEMNAGDVLCYGLDEKLVSCFAQNSPPVSSFS